MEEHGETWFWMLCPLKYFINLHVPPLIYMSEYTLASTPAPHSSYDHNNHHHRHYYHHYNLLCW